MFIKKDIEKIKKGLPYTLVITNLSVQEMVDTIEQMEEIIQIYASIENDADWAKEARDFLEEYRK